MGWKKMLAYISGSVDEELLKRNAYLIEENRVLHQRIDRRIRFTDGERIKLAAAELPPGLDAQAATAIRRAIKESFVAGFRLAMLIASGLALISAGVAWAMIEGKPGGSEPGSSDMSRG